MSYAAMQLGERSRQRCSERDEAVLCLPLSDELAALLQVRAKLPLSRPETATLRRLLFEALDVAVGKGHKS